MEKPTEEIIVIPERPPSAAKLAKVKRRRKGKTSTSTAGQSESKSNATAKTNKTTATSTVGSDAPNSSPPKKAFTNPFRSKNGESGENLLSNEKKKKEKAKKVVVALAKYLSPIRVSKFLLKMIFTKGGIFRLWNLIILITVTINVSLVFFRSFFPVENLYFVVMDVMVDLLNFMDIVMNLFSKKSMEDYKLISTNIQKSDKKENEEQKKKKKMTKQGIFEKFHLNLYYVTHYHFIFDIFSCIPFYLASIPFLWGYYSMFRLNSTIKVIKFNTLFSYIQKTLNSVNSSVIRLIYTVIISLLIIHVVGCLWFAMMNLEGDNLGRPFVPGGVDILSMNNFQRYLRSFYISLITLTGYYNAQPKTNFELIFSFIFSGLGLILYTSIISSIGNLFSEIDIGSTVFQNKMDEINEFFRLRKVSSKIAQRIRDYYTHLWKSRRSLNEETILHDLPMELRIEILLSLNKAMIEKVPFFQEKRAKEGSNEKGKVNKQFINQLLLKIRPILAPPKSVIISNGSIGKEMYFIAKGLVEVLVGENETRVTTLGAGNYFGEIALLIKNTKRTASIRAVEYTDLYKITKEDLIDVLKGFPKQMKIVEKEAIKRKKQASEAKKDAKKKEKELKREKSARIPSRIKSFNGKITEEKKSGNIFLGTPSLQKLKKLSGRFLKKLGNSPFRSKSTNHEEEEEEKNNTPSK